MGGVGRGSCGGGVPSPSSPGGVFPRAVAQEEEEVNTKVPLPAEGEGALLLCPASTQDIQTLRV